jgi:hypothetical protein
MNPTLMKVLSELGTEILIAVMRRVATMLHERADAKGFEKDHEETIHKLCDDVLCSGKYEEEHK